MQSKFNDKKKQYLKITIRKIRQHINEWNELWIDDGWMKKTRQKNLKTADSSDILSNIIKIVPSKFLSF